ncbi:MAG: tRNA (guanosine(46)-N7)-methyltransferase TrmB [Ignavibacteria bacterium]|nr:tRNA (guanosine(46)-N7)-methyltransferase TrmB [Ignavibacteria bacterium]
MARTKLKKFTKLSKLTNVFNIKSPDIKETLHNYFKAGKNFTLEIGCGHGDYSVELAQKFPNRNFIGIDIKGARIYRGAMVTEELKLNNVAFVITRAERLNEIFIPKSIEEIYIPFPEPHVRRTSQNRRLISPSFLKIYKELLVDSGILHFRTDSQELFEYAIKSIADSQGEILHLTEDLHNDENLKIKSIIMTSFEKHYINGGRKIKYICFRF